MRQKILFLLFSSLAICFSKENQSTHIENPTFGSEGRYKIIHEEFIQKEEGEEQKYIEGEKENKNEPIKFFTCEEFEKTNSQSISEFLSSKGFLMMYSGGNGTKNEFSYKGFTSFCIKVYIDGILANDSVTGEFDWNSIDINSIESISIEDVPSLNESEFAGCVVRISTKARGEKFYDSLKVETGVSSFKNSLFDSFYGSYNYGKKIDDFSFNLSGNISNSKNEYERDIYSGTNVNNFSRQANFSFGWNKSFKNNSLVNGEELIGNDSQTRRILSGFNSVHYTNLKALGTGPNLNNGIETDISTKNNLKYSFQNQKVKSDVNLIYNVGSVNYQTTGDSGKKETSFSKIGMAHTIEWICNFNYGINFEWILKNPEYWRGVVNFGISKRFDFDSFFVEPQIVGLFWLKESCGARILPRVVVGYKDLNFSAYRMCVLPTFNHLYWPETDGAKGNPNLVPEEGWGLTVGFKTSDFPLWVQYNFSYYKNKIRWTNDNFIEGASGVLSLYPTNSGEGIYNIFSIGISQGFFENKLIMEADGTYNRARLCSTGKQIMWVPEWQAHGSISFAFWRINLMLDYSFTGRRWTSNDNLIFYPEIHLVDFSINGKFSENVQGYLKVNNLLDQRVVYHDNYFIQSRKFTIGVRIQK